MKAFSPALAAHLAGGVTTLCTCWRIFRADGTVLGFTDHDRTIAFGGVSHEPATGSMRARRWRMRVCRSADWR